MRSAGGEPPTANCTPAPNGGFVPVFRKVRSFVINQIGGFVFEKLLALSSQLSVRGNSPFTISAGLFPYSTCRLPDWPAICAEISACVRDTLGALQLGSACRVIENSQQATRGPREGVVLRSFLRATP